MRREKARAAPTARPKVSMRRREPIALRKAQRCGARNRSGNPCRSPVVKGKRRCRMHGGALGSGAPKGARNGNYKHGRYTEEVQATRRWLREATQLLRSFR